MKYILHWGHSSTSNLQWLPLANRTRPFTAWTPSISPVACLTLPHVRYSDHSRLLGVSWAHSPVFVYLLECPLPPCPLSNLPFILQVPLKCISSLSFWNLTSALPSPPRPHDPIAFLFFHLHVEYSYLFICLSPAIDQKPPKNTKKILELFF